MVVLSWIATAVDYLHRLAVVVIMVAATFGILALPSQTLELYIIYAQAALGRIQDWQGGRDIMAAADFVPTRQFAFGLVAMALFSGMLWLGALRLLSISRRDAQDSDPLRPRHLWMAAGFALMPAAALFVGFRRAIARDPAQLADERTMLDLSAIGLVVVVLIGVGAATLLLRGRYRQFAAAVFSLRGFGVGTLAVAAFVTALVLSPVALPTMLGTLAIVGLFMTIVSYLVTAFAAVRRYYGIPVSTALALVVVTFSFLDLNDNHRVEATIEPAPTIGRLLETTGRLDPEENEFLDWLQGRGDLDSFGGRRYPVYLVSAEGGGLYAAYHAASTLARLQDECPSFAQHTFAISSVSGGSLGGAVFAALANQRADNGVFVPCRAPATSQEFQRFVDRYFESDLLSPLVAAALFPDALQRLLPVPVYAFDRARALEASFEVAWARAAEAEGWPKEVRARNPFANPTGQLSSATSAAPTLMLNATSLALGARIIISPMRVAASPTANHITQALRGFKEGPAWVVDMKLSSAVSLSARFPWVTPVGWIDRCRSGDKALPCPESGASGRRLYLADGGFFENSGLEVVVDLAKKIRALPKKLDQLITNEQDDEIKRLLQRKLALLRKVQLRILQISAYDDFGRRWQDEAFALSHGGQGELLGPIEALLNTRRARTRAVEDSTFSTDAGLLADGGRPSDVAAGQFFDAALVPERPYAVGYHRAILNGTSFFLPLGWHLSETTRANIGGNRSVWLGYTRCQIRREMMGELPPDATQPWQPCLDQAKNAG